MMTSSPRSIAADDTYIIDVAKIKVIENGESAITIWFDLNEEPWFLTYENPEQQQQMYEKIRDAMRLQDHWQQQ